MLEFLHFSTFELFFQNSRSTCNVLLFSCQLETNISLTMNCERASYSLHITAVCIVSVGIDHIFVSSFVFIILSSLHNERPFWIINGQRYRRQRYVLPHQTNFTMGAKGHFAWWQPDNGMWQGKLACHTLVRCLMFCECLWFWKQVLYVYHFGERAGEWERKKGIVLRKRKTGDWNGKLPFALISVLGHCGGTQTAAWDGSRPCFISRRVFFMWET